MPPVEESLWWKGKNDFQVRVRWSLMRSLRCGLLSALLFTFFKQYEVYVADRRNMNSQTQWISLANRACSSLAKCQVALDFLIFLDIPASSAPTFLDCLQEVLKLSSLRFTGHTVKTYSKDSNTYFNSFNSFNSRNGKCQYSWSIRCSLISFDKLMIERLNLVFVTRDVYCKFWFVTRLFVSQ